MKSNEIKWNQMNSNEIKWNQMKSNEIKWNQMQGDYRGILTRMYKKCTEFFRMYKNVHSLKCTKKCTKF